MNIYQGLSGLLSNDLLKLKESSFKLAPQFMPTGLTEEDLNNRPLSFIIGEHPSDYAMSPPMWNAEYQLTGKDNLFLPADIHVENQDKLCAVLDLALELGNKHFRVLTVTDPHKVAAFKHMQKMSSLYPGRIIISEDAEKIGATNQILIGPDNVFHVINSDGRGMANSVENFLAEKSRGELAGKYVGIVGAGGAGRAIIFETAKRVASTSGGCVTVFNRTVEKAEEIVREYSQYFPGLLFEARPLADLKELAANQDVIISSVTTGDPLADNQAYEIMAEGTLVVDAKYAENSILAANAESAGRSDLDIHDGGGMVFEGYKIPSQELAELWGYRVEDATYKKIAAILGYQPREQR